MFTHVTRKTVAIVSIACCLIVSSNMASGQLKLYANGSVSIGSIISPPANTEMQVDGTSIFSANSGTITSAACIRGLNAYSADTNPDYTWWNDAQVGIFHPAAKTMAFSVAGRTTMMLSPGNNIVIDSSVDNGDRMQVYASANQNPFDIYSNASNNNLYSGVNWVNNITTKAWDVKNGTQDQFYVYGNGQAYSYGWNLISDSTLKENVLGITDALNKVKRLQGVTYNYKSNLNTTESNSNRQMGLIAQAVQRVVPEVVTTNGNGIKAIAYSNMVGLLVEAIKQEDAKINVLQLRLDSCIAANKTPEKTNDGTDEKAMLYPCSSCPANQETTFHCYVPSNTKTASLMVFDMNGALKKTIPIAGRESQYVSVNKGALSAGMYYYSLLVDGKEVGTNKVILTQD